MDGYIWFGLNRKMHTKACRASGGVGMLVRSSLFQYYSIEIIEKDDGIIGLLFEHKLSEYNFVIFSCYLPPENSPWGRDASAFFCRLLSLVYQFSEVDAIYIGGDINARIGNLEDFIPTIDSIPQRAAIDDFVNKHGETFLEFLRDSKMCVLNGRIDPLYDNYTSVSPKGKAVVDYVVTPFDCLDNCVEFKVLLVSQMVEDNVLFNCITT